MSLTTFAAYYDADGKLLGPTVDHLTTMVVIQLYDSEDGGVRRSWQFNVDETNSLDSIKAIIGIIQECVIIGSDYKLEQLKNVLEI